MVGCSEYTSSEGNEVEKENMQSVIDKINNSYYNLSGLGVKEVIFDVKSNMMIALLDKIKKEKNIQIEPVKLTATWGANKVKSLKTDKPLAITDKILNLSVTKMLDSVEKGLNSTLKMFDSYNGNLLIGDASKVQTIYKTKEGIIIEKNSKDVTVKERLYFDNEFKLKKSLIYKVINGQEKAFFEFLPKFKKVNNKYVLKEMQSNAKQQSLTTYIKYNYFPDSIIIFPAIIEYILVSDRIRYSEVLEVAIISTKPSLQENSIIYKNKF